MERRPKFIEDPDHHQFAKSTVLPPSDSISYFLLHQQGFASLQVAIDIREYVESTLNSQYKNHLLRLLQSTPTLCSSNANSPSSRSTVRRYPLRCTVVSIHNYSPPESGYYSTLNSSNKRQASGCASSMIDPHAPITAHGRAAECGLGTKPRPSER